MNLDSSKHCVQEKARFALGRVFLFSLIVKKEIALRMYNIKVLEIL